MWFFTFAPKSVFDGPPVPGFLDASDNKLDPAPADIRLRTVYRPKHDTQLGTRGSA